MSLRRQAHGALSFARGLKPRSALRYAVWRARGNHDDMRVRLRNGYVAEVRGGTGDYWILSEIFFNHQYVMPPGVAPDVLTVVDTGANVGYAALWFLGEYPGCRITAFEPLPHHVAQIEKHLTGNGLRERVELVAAAAATGDGTAVFQDHGPETRPSEDGEGVEVALVDWFERLPEGPIDVLKMDIEGGEVPLLEDPRFAAVAARTQVFVLEWHQDARGREWCVQQMERAGFTVTEGARYGTAGLLWGINSAYSAS